MEGPVGSKNTGNMLDFTHKSQEETTMSIGEKIALIRKNENLSQEAFGEILGVSRQAISKWESDMSVPDIDNLIIISRRFGVSAGWILGIEEEGHEEKLSKEDISEVLEDYLLRFSEMSEQYKPLTKDDPEKQKKNVKFRLFAFILAGCMLLWNVSLSYKIRSLSFQAEQNSAYIASISNQLRSELNSLRNDLINADSSESVLLNYSYDYTEYDPEKNMVTLSVSFILQHVENDSEVTVCIDSYDGDMMRSSYYSLAEYDENMGKYTAQITAVIMQDMRMYISIKDSTGTRGAGVCELDVYNKVSPVKLMLEYTENEKIKLEDGKITKGDYDFFTLTQPFENTFLGQTVKTVKTELVCLHNDKIIKTAQMQDNYGKQMQLGLDLSDFLKDFTFGEEDTLTFEVRTTDNYGRKYASSGCVYIILREEYPTVTSIAPTDDVNR